MLSVRSCLVYQGLLIQVSSFPQKTPREEYNIGLIGGDGGGQLCLRVRVVRVCVCARARVLFLGSVQSQTEQRTKSPFMAINATTPKKYTNYSALIEMKALELGRGPLMGEWRQGCGLCLCITL